MSDTTNLVEKNSNEPPDNSTEDILRKLVNEAIEHNRQQSRLIKEYLDKKILKGKYAFRFPFILKEKHIRSFQQCIQRRLHQEYNENYELKFKCLVEFKNNDKLTYRSIDDFFAANHEETMLRVHLDWEYTIYETFENLCLPIAYDIIIFYEIEQDSDQRELFKLEEWGAIQVENSKNDWINGTLKELKPLINATRMPFWWYYPKKVLLALREYTYILIWIVALLITMQFIGSFFEDTNSLNSRFIEESNLITDASEKLQAYIEYTLKPISNNYISVFVLALIAAVLAVLLTKASRHIFPPSMILIGCTQSKLKYKLVAYNFIWGAIITAIIGLVVVNIISV